MKITMEMMQKVRSYADSHDGMAQVARDMDPTGKVMSYANLHKWTKSPPEEPSRSTEAVFLKWYAKHIDSSFDTEPEKSIFTDVPILGSAQAAGFEPALEAWDAWIKGHGDGVAQFAGAKQGWFALKVEGDSMTPEYPHGTLLLVAAGEFPQRGDIVVARVAHEGQVVCKRYQRKNGDITLESINPNGKSYSWNVKENPGYVLWMWPVVKAEIDLRAKRWEETKTGGC